MKVVIDTNIWISFLFGKSFQNLIEIINQNDIKVYTCEKQLVELINTMKKPKISKFIKEKDINNLIFFFKYNLNFVSIKNELQFLRDPEDNYLIEIAIKSDSKYIITGDKDFLDVKNYKQVEFVNFNQFLNLLQNENK